MSKERMRAIIFDLDQTLFDRRQAFSLWLDSLSLTSDTHHYLTRLDHNGHGDRSLFLQELNRILASERPIYENLKLQSLEPVQQTDFVATLLRFTTFDSDLKRWLARLKTQYVTAILTNGGSVSQRAKLRALGIDTLIPPEHVFISGEIGIEKPDRRIFDFVAGQINIEPANCLYFGDSRSFDIDAARAAGWRAVHVDGPAQLVSELNRLHCDQQVLV